MNLKELGAYLKEIRINNGVSLEEASEDLNMTSMQLENIESGNTRAFQDVYSLKEYVKAYAKYLGLEPEKVLDEFNDFLFEHTSKISLTDILEEEAKRKEKEKAQEKKKIASPYTRIKQKKITNPAPFVLATLSLILFVLIVYLVLRVITDKKKIDTELQGIQVDWSEVYEYTY